MRSFLLALAVTAGACFSQSIQYPNGQAPNLVYTGQWLYNNKAGLGACGAGAFAVQTTAGGVVCLAVDWSVVTGKPATFAPAAHASTHASAGSDPVTPAAIGALPLTGGAISGNLNVAGTLAISGTVLRGGGAALPGTCSIGDQFFLTTGVTGNYQCTATNTWTLPGGGSGTAPYSCAVSGVSSIACTHSLNTSTPWVACYDGSGNMLGSTGASTSVTSVVATSANVATLTFSGTTTATCVISTGTMGPAGTNGSAATVTLGTVSTGAAGSSVVITNSGTSGAATFNFTVPRGDTGAAGSGTGDVLTTGTNTYTSSAVNDARAAAHTLPAKTGLVSALPGTCTAGEEFFATDATAGQNKYYCTATNTWTQQLNSGGGGASSGTALPGTCTVGAQYALTAIYTGAGYSHAPGIYYCAATNTWARAGYGSEPIIGAPALPTTALGVFGDPCTGGCTVQVQPWRYDGSTASWTKLALYVQTAAGSAATGAAVGLYDSSGTAGRAGALIAQAAQISMNATGMHIATVGGGSVTLSAGLYYVAVATEDNTMILYGYSRATQTLTAANSGAYYTHGYCTNKTTGTGVSLALPASCGAVNNYVAGMTQQPVSVVMLP